MERFVTISGDKDALEELEKVCKSPDLFIERERGNFVLKSKDFNELKNDEEIYKQACEKVALLNGAVKLALGYKGSLCVELVVRVSDNGRWNSHAIISVGSSSSGKLIMEMTKADGTLISEAAPVPQWISLARKNKNVAEVLNKIADKKLDWNKLNVILEDVQGDIGSKINEWVDSKEVNRFTQTVQDKRHGDSGLKKCKWQSPKKPMNFEEAKALIMKIIENWLNSKIIEQVKVHETRTN